MAKAKVHAAEPPTTPSKTILASPKRKPRKNKICFSPAPIVHEFDTSSPTSRRMEVRFKKIDTVDDDALINELDARGLRKNTRSTRQRISRQQKQLLREHWVTEMKNELLSMGLNSKGNHLELAERIHLADLLRRRAQIQMAYGEDIVLPIHMCDKKLNHEVEKRKIVVDNSSRKAKVEALETALVKENEPLIGDGYEFGRRLVTAADLVEAQDMDNNELRAALKLRGLKAPQKKEQKKELLQKLIENELESMLRKTFHEVLIDEFKRRGIEIPDGHKQLPKKEEITIRKAEA